MPPNQKLALMSVADAFGLDQLHRSLLGLFQTSAADPAYWRALLSPTPMLGGPYAPQNVMPGVQGGPYAAQHLDPSTTALTHPTIAPYRGTPAPPRKTVHLSPEDEARQVTAGREAWQAITAPVPIQGPGAGGGAGEDRAPYRGAYVPPAERPQPPGGGSGEGSY